MILLDGRKLAERILFDIKHEIESRKLKLKLVVIQVGDDQISNVYIDKKKNTCEFVGIDFELVKFSADIDKNELREAINKIINDQKVSGIVIQLPLPKRFIAEEFLDLIPKEKDVDILAEESFKLFSRGESKILPPTVGAITTLLKDYNIGLENKKIVIVGAGRLIGKPLESWFELQKLDFAILDKSTKDISILIKDADILISGTGKANLINGDMIKHNAIVIDAGSSTENGKTSGDIEFESVSKKASYITPTIGGVGPLTVACLLRNLVELNK